MTPPDTDIVKQLREEIAHLSKDNRALTRERMEQMRSLREMQAQLDGDPNPIIATLKSQIEDLEARLDDAKAEAGEAAADRDAIEEKVEAEHARKTNDAIRYLTLAAEGRAPNWCDVCNTARGHTPDCLVRAVAG